MSRTVERLLVGAIAFALLAFALSAGVVRAVRERRTRPGASQGPPRACPPATAEQLRSLLAIWKLGGIRSPGALAAGFRAAQRSGRDEVEDASANLTHSHSHRHGA